MTPISPLIPIHEQAGASMARYGPPEVGPLVPETFDELELEYAALRRSCALVDQPQRGLLELTGSDRLEFLERMLTQKVGDLTARQVRRSFWLDRKGRIAADLRVIELPGRTLLEMDVLVAQKTATTLGQFLITEDVSIEDRSEQAHRLSMYGPGAWALLAAASSRASEAGVPDPDRACRVQICGHRLEAFRDDWAGPVGLELIVDAEHVVDVYTRLLECGGAIETDAVPGRQTIRRAGWHALNIARIEAGQPIFNIDFGPDALPHETGVLHDRVSFTKGCYLGQEIVARMESLGHPRRRLVALRIEADGDAPTPQPIGGSLLTPIDDPASTPVGVVTSSAISPMLGSEPICLAMVRWAASEPGTRLSVSADGRRAVAVIQPRLRFWATQ